MVEDVHPVRNRPYLFVPSGPVSHPHFPLVPTRSVAVPVSSSTRPLMAETK